MSRRLAAVLALGLLARLAFLTSDFRTTNDLPSFRSWSRGLAERGVTAAYEDRTIDYPPLSVLLFSAAGAAERALPPAWRSGDRALTAAVKLLPALADAGIAALLALAWRRRAGGSGAGVAAAYLLNPAIWYVSAHWGQVDAVYTLFLVAAVLALGEARLASAGVALGASAATKLQGLLLAPLLAAAALKRGGLAGLARAAGGAFGALLLLASPWLLSGRGGELTRLVTELPSEPPRVSVTGYNLWYLFFGGKVAGVSSERAVPGLPLDYQALSLLVLGAFALAIAFLAARSSRWGLGAAALAMGLYTLATQVHERYLFAALPLLLLAASEAAGAERRGLLGAYALLSATFAFNLVTIAPFAPWLGINLVVASESPRTSFLRAVALACAALHVALLAALLPLLASRRPSGTRTDPG